MLPRIISVIFLLASLIIVSKLIYDSTIFQFWSTQWVVGTLSTLVLMGAGIALLFLGEDKFGYAVLAVFGTLYGIASVVVYIAWAYQHIFNALQEYQYLGFLILLFVISIVSAIVLGVYAKQKSSKIFVLPAWSFAFANVGAIFAVIWKYVFEQSEWYFWPFVGEIIIVVIGAVWFISAYNVYAKIS